MGPDPFARFLVDRIATSRTCRKPRLKFLSLLELRVPWQLDPGSTVRVGLRAEDVLLALDEPGRISARNVIPGVVSSCETRGENVWVEVAAGDRVTAKLTADAARKLDLREGLQVFLVFKAHVAQAGLERVSRWPRPSARGVRRCARA